MILHNLPAYSVHVLYFSVSPCLDEGLSRQILVSHQVMVRILASDVGVIFSCVGPAVTGNCIEALHNVCGPFAVNPCCVRWY